MGIYIKSNINVRKTPTLRTMNLKLCKFLRMQLTSFRLVQRQWPTVTAHICAQSWHSPFNFYIQYYWYSILLMRLTPPHFTGADLGISSLSHNVALTPDTPPADSMAFFNWPELRYILTWLLVVAALLSHYPLPPCGSEKSSFTLMWYLLATCWIASNMDALWEHPALSCLKHTQFTSSGIVVLSCSKTSSMIARTVMLSWLQLSRMCTNVSIWGWPSEFLMTVVMCHEIPRLPNQSDWLLRSFLRRY